MVHRSDTVLYSGNLYLTPIFLLAAWQPVLFETRKQSEFKSLVRWAIDVDPLAI